MESESQIEESGIVKVYYPLKGFGFITRSKGKDIFFHRLDIGDEAWALEGAHVRFLVVSSERGLQARGIKRIG
ncbi:MAG: cold shock domain-containing protein [Hydrogenophaga sp.]|nr:cold shock domain-containing protein [Hydrogenophaga sp.]